MIIRLIELPKRANLALVHFCAALTVFMISYSSTADASSAASSGPTLSTLVGNVNISLEDVPKLITTAAYISGLVMGTLGITKVKDHVENPGNTPLKEGAARLMAGGAMLSLPIILESLSGTIGPNSLGPLQPRLRPIQFGVAS